ncbi:hypothetical protein AB0R12_04625 [Streptomyces niveus]
MSCISRATRVRSAAAASLIRWSRSMSRRRAWSSSAVRYIRRVRTVRPLATAATTATVTEIRALIRWSPGTLTKAHSRLSPTNATPAQPSISREPCRARAYRATSDPRVAAFSSPVAICARETTTVTKKTAAGARRRHQSGTTNAADRRYGTAAGVRARSPGSS